MAKHTPEPWTAEYGDGYGRADVQSAEFNGYRGNKIVARCHLPEKPGGGAYDIEQAEANASRIAACVNACAGIPTGALENGVLAKAIALLAAAGRDEYGSPVPIPLRDTAATLTIILRGEG